MNLTKITPGVRTDYTVSALGANLSGLGIFFFIFGAFVLPHSFLSGTAWWKVAVAALDWPLGVLGVSFLTGLVIHELLHGIGFYYFGGVPRSKIRYGINWRGLMPYATTSEPMSVEAYRAAALLPLAVNIIPAVIGTMMENSGLVSFSALMAGGAGGDVLVVWLIRGVGRGTRIRDSSARIGCEVVDVDFA